MALRIVDGRLKGFREKCFYQNDNEVRMFREERKIQSFTGSER